MIYTAIINAFYSKFAHILYKCIHATWLRIIFPPLKITLGIQQEVMRVFAPCGTTRGGGTQEKCMQRLCGCVLPWRQHSEKVSRGGCFSSFRDFFL